MSVAVYPSEFGLKRMEEEAIHGPVGLFEDGKKNNQNDEDDDEIDNEKLRTYELSRLRWHVCSRICAYTYLLLCLFFHRLSLISKSVIFTL